MTTITRFTVPADFKSAGTKLLTDAARLLTTSAVRTRAASARALTAALALVGAGALALIACHPDDVVTPADGEMITLSATAALPGAGITTRTATTSRDVYFTGTTPMDIVLNKYTGSAADATATAYAYTLTPNKDSEATGAAIAPMPAFNTVPDATKPGGISVPSGSTVYLGIPQMKMELKMKLPTGIVNTRGNTAQGSETALVPFFTRMEMPNTPLKASTTLALPLTYATAALCLKLVIADGAKVATATCLNLPMAGDNATRSLTPTRTDGFGEGNGMLREGSDPTKQTVIFGELTPGSTLQPGNLIALLQLDKVTNPDGTTTPGKLLAVKWPASLGTKTVPAAGQMMTLTVHVDRTVAGIDPDNITIGGFANGNGNGEDITVGYQGADGTQPLDTKIFNASNPLWVVAGGGSDNEAATDKTVLTNVRAALDAMGTTRASTEGTIDLVLTGVTSLPTYVKNNYNYGAFADYPQLRSISLPKVTTIGYSAFNACTGLTSVSLPAATTIGKYAFTACTSLTSVSLPAATKIEGYAFDGCVNLASLSLPAMTEIWWSLFTICSNLVKLDISGVTDAKNITDGDPNLPSPTPIPTPAPPSTGELGNIHEIHISHFFFPAPKEKKPAASGKKSGAATRDDTSSSAFNSELCDLIISRTLYDGLSANDIKEKTFCDKTWLSITPKP